MDSQTCALTSHNVPCRPLPAELLQYAQADVHYMCFLAGQLGARLAAKGPGHLQEARKRSLEMCLALYSKPASEVWDSAGPPIQIGNPTSDAYASMRHTDALWQWQHTISHPC